MVGCRLNQAEIEAMASSLVVRGFEITENPENADYIVINTCCVTEKAAADSRKMIRRYARQAQAKLIATGCWTTLFEKDARKMLPDLHLVHNSAKDAFGNTFAVPNVPDGHKHFDAERQSRPFLGNRQRTRAFVKVQDGCNNSCSYCATQLARGPSKSRNAQEILLQIQDLVQSGVKEAVLCGVQLGSWGKEHRDELSSLVKLILDRTKIARLRLSSIEPWDITPNLIALWENERLMPHLHIPVQSGAAKILRTMRRPGNPGSYLNMLRGIRAFLPEMAISTDLIVGFPGETDADFFETMAFVDEACFSRGHVFQFSAVQGTDASHFDLQVPSIVKKERSAKLRNKLSESQNAYNQSWLGKVVPVLFEAQQNGVASGHSPQYQRVQVLSDENLQNRILNVRLSKLRADVFEGELVSARKDAFYPRYPYLR